jgi:hypothetical protein
MKRTVIISSAVALLVFVLVVAAFVVVTNKPSNQKGNQNPKPFYVGVTYCGEASYQGGNATSEAKLLIDRVKNCTNLFVLQSGSVQMDLHETQTICDYAVANGLYVIIYLSSWDSSPYRFQSLIDMAKQAWGSHFLGVYYGDEPGGKLLDASSVSLRDGGMDENVTRRLPAINGLPSSLTFSKSE